MKGRLEHANIRVRSFDDAVDFLRTAIPTFRIRGEGVGSDGRRWMHVGSDDSYLAISEAADSENESDSFHWHGVNHLGFEVDDAESVKRRLEAKGYREGFLAEPHQYRKRVYFFDREGNEWEFVEYLTDDVAKRNDYSRD